MHGGKKKKNPIMLNGIYGNGKSLVVMVLPLVDLWFNIKCKSFNEKIFDHERKLESFFLTFYI